MSPGIGTAIAENLPASTQLAGKYLIGKGAAQVGRKVIRGAARFVGRWFRSKTGKRVGVHPGIRTARGGSAITRGKLDLGGGQAFRAGGTAFNVRAAAGVAAAGVGGSVAVGKLVRPSAAVHVAMGRSAPAPRVDFTTPTHAPVSRSSPAPRSSTASSPSPSTSSGRQRRCGCPAGQRMLCFKRRHNPEAEAKRRARRKAAREKAKGKTAKRHAKERAAVERRKATRAARGARRAMRRVSAKQRAARARFAKAARRGPIRKGTRL